MKYLRLFLTLVLILSVSLPLYSQNNQYKIHDSCYPYYRQADSLLGFDEFNNLIEKLMAQAQKVNDMKAYTLGYTLKLRHAIRKEDEAKVISCFNEMRKVSIETGYHQYFYYAYQLISSYYLNLQQVSKGMEYANKMHEEALERNSDYGKWYSAKYLASLYMINYQRNATVRYLKEAIDTYNTTEDSTIRCQSMTKTYVKLAMLNCSNGASYQPYIDKALETSKISIDTIVVYYCYALKYALAHIAANRELTP